MTEFQERFLTIREMFEELLDEQTIQIFRFVYNGSLYAGTPKKQARISICLPRTIVDQNLKDLDKFVFFGVAIPRNVIDALPDKKENDKKDD